MEVVKTFLSFQVQLKHHPLLHSTTSFIFFKTTAYCHPGQLQAALYLMPFEELHETGQ